MVHSLSRTEQQHYRKAPAGCAITTFVAKPSPVPRRIIEYGWKHTEAGQFIV